ncbi:hypothetical protein PO909_002747 [Leuciscus waleckii]
MISCYQRILKNKRLDPKKSVICFGRPKEANTVLSKLGIGRQGQELMFTRRGQADESISHRKALAKRQRRMGRLWDRVNQKLIKCVISSLHLDKQHLFMGKISGVLE